MLYGITSVEDGLFIIESVKRLSDEVIFKIGDSFDGSFDGSRHSIAKFTINRSNEMIIHTPENIDPEDRDFNPNGHMSLDNGTIKVEAAENNERRTWMSRGFGISSPSISNYYERIDQFEKKAKIKEEEYIKPVNGKYTIDDIRMILKTDAGLDENDIEEIMKCFKKTEEKVEKVLEKIAKPIDAILKSRNRRGR